MDIYANDPHDQERDSTDYSELRHFLERYEKFLRKSTKKRKHKKKGKKKRKLKKKLKALELAVKAQQRPAWWQSTLEKSLPKTIDTANIIFRHNLSKRHELPDNIQHFTTRPKGG